MSTYQIINTNSTSVEQFHHIDENIAMLLYLYVDVDAVFCVTSTISFRRVCGLFIFICSDWNALQQWYTVNYAV